jgi:drug/metabolite transporter (DMT)-like permease
MNEIVFALIAFFGWGTGDIFGTVAARKLGGFSSTLWSYVFRVIIFAILIPFYLVDLSRLTIEMFLFNIFLGVIGIIGLVSFNEGLKGGNAALVGTIAASYVMLVVIFSIIFLKEAITQSQIISILVIFIGLILSTLDLKQLKKSKVILNRSILLALIAMIVWGFYFTFIKIPVKQIGWFWPNYITVALFPLIFIFAKLRKVKLHSPKYKGAFWFAFVSALLIGIAEYSFIFGINTGLTTIVAPIAGAYPILFVILAFLVFKDPITRQQKFGILITLIGIVLLSVF